MSEKPVTVFAVSYGSYSDYGVHCLFATRELAEAYDGAEHVEEFQLWDHAPARFDTYEIYATVEADGRAWAFGGSAGERPVEMKHTILDETSRRLDEHTIHSQPSHYAGRNTYFVKVEGVDRNRVQADFDRLVAEAQAKLSAPRGQTQ